MSEHQPRILDPNQKQETTYAIPLWLRDLQIKNALEKVKGRIQPHPERTDSVAVVGFGPSLQDTWELIREFKYVISCSGSHKFLIERGIVPNWHVEVDPRDHKIGLLGEPHPDVIYLPSSTSHPKYLEHLEKGLGDKFDTNVLLWHVFDNSEDGIRVLPRGEWQVTGGCDVGLRSIGIAAFLGFRDLHVFGLDGCARETRHAGPHPNTPKKYDICPYDGVEYKTTAGMLEAARQVWHELDQMPAVKVKFYGDGLIQHMARNYKPNHSKVPAVLQNVVGISQPELISSEYKELNARLHKENLAYGVGGGRHAPVIMKLVANVTEKDASGKPVPPSVLDYGAGKGALAKALPFAIWEYDPAVPGKDEPPRAADVVACTDVLEHIEPEKLPYVLDDLRRCVKKVGYFVISTRAAAKTYADGRNTHLIIQGRDWWKHHLKRFFYLIKIVEKGSELHVFVAPKIKAKPKVSVKGEMVAA